MECHYHPEREATDICAICGKSICKECGLEIAGKFYCKDCLEKIVGLGLDNTSKQNTLQPKQDPIEKQPIEESVYQPQEEYETPYSIEEPAQEYKAINDDSPYNIKDNIEYTGGLESSYISESESSYQSQPEVAQNEYEFYPQEEITQQVSQEPEYIYPDHSYEPDTTSARKELEDKYEKYLDDLYFDEKEVPLGEQLAKDEEQYGSLTKKEYTPKPAQKVSEKPIPKNETPEEMEARIRAEIEREHGLRPDDEDKKSIKGKRGKKSKKDKDSIHNLNYKEEKEPMGIVDIILTIILIFVILVVLYYILYLFILSSSYPTFMDAVYALKNPQNVINALLSH